MKQVNTRERTQWPTGRRRRLRLVPIFAGVLLAALVSQYAQARSGGNYRLDWFTIDSGGGTCRGGAFALNGTIGQPDAGWLEGGSFKLEGGFWHGVSIQQTPSAPVLSIRLVGNGQAVISWPVGVTGFVLEETGALNAAWTTMLRPVVDTATEHTVVVPASAPMRCYRLKKTQP